MKTINALQPRDTTRLLRVARTLAALASDIEGTLGEKAQRQRRRGRPRKAKPTAKAPRAKKSKKYPVDAPPPADAAAAS